MRGKDGRQGSGIAGRRMLKKPYVKTSGATHFCESRRQLWLLAFLNCWQFLSRRDRAVGVQAAHQSFEQAIGLAAISRGDPQVFVGAWSGKMPHQHSAGAQCCGQYGAVVRPVAREDEVRRRWQDLKAKLDKRLRHPVSFSNHYRAAALEVLLVFQRRDRPGLSGPTKGVGVKYETCRPRTPCNRF